MIDSKYSIKLMILHYCKTGKNNEKNEKKKKKKKQIAHHTPGIQF